MFRKYLPLVALVLAIASCMPKPSVFDRTKAEEEILQLHKAQRDYHFQKDSIAFANQMGLGYISVNRGQITQPTVEDNISRYNNYFSAVEFVKWDDVSPPEIRFSDDGSMAYTVVDKEVIVEYKVSETETILDSAYYAWVAIYKKQAEGWKLDCVASTNR
ncbi:MAG: hypothetical protein KTR30_37225 [Saprospiraceae bacterium]|nr:hypothetical protein [Saprospiraceae bacterium]